MGKKQYLPLYFYFELLISSICTHLPVQNLTCKLVLILSKQKQKRNFVQIKNTGYDVVVILVPNQKPTHVRNNIMGTYIFHTSKDARENVEQTSRRSQTGFNTFYPKTKSKLLRESELLFILEFHSLLSSFGA